VQITWGTPAFVEIKADAEISRSQGEFGEDGRAA
jgi:hypothetical protein